jgi:hypothetical protein
VAGKAEERLSEVFDEGLPVADGWAKKRAPGAAVVGAELGDGGFEGVFEGDGGAVVEWMGYGDWRLDPAEAVVGERETAEEGAGDAEGVAGGAEIVVEAGEGDFGGGARSPERGVALVDCDGDASLREGNGGGEAVGAGTDDVGGLERHVVVMLPQDVASRIPLYGLLG